MRRFFSTAWLVLCIAAQAHAFSAVGDVKITMLPPEARETIVHIRKGGPFPYQKDGSVFGNREKILPQRERGWYREYTVRTPGEKARGARRIVAGRDGTLYYTDDHYRSFRRVVEK